MQLVKDANLVTLKMLSEELNLSVTRVQQYLKSLEIAPVGRLRAAGRGGPSLLFPQSSVNKVKKAMRAAKSPRIVLF